MNAQAWTIRSDYRTSKRLDLLYDREKAPLLSIEKKKPCADTYLLFTKFASFTEISLGQTEFIFQNSLLQLEALPNTEGSKRMTTGVGSFTTEIDKKKGP